MKILFVMGDPHLPQYTGGAQSSCHELALELMALGHQVAILCQLVPSGMVGLKNRLKRRLSGQVAVADSIQGYPVYRQWEVLEGIPAVVRAFKPDVAVAQIGQQVRVAQILQDCGVPCLVYIRNVEMNELEGDPRTIPGVKFIANSQFTAGRFQSMFGIDPAVIPPLLIPEQYRVFPKGGHVTFVNPRQLKGFDIVLEIAARMPEVPFHVIESWTLGREDRDAINARIKPLPNVRFRSRTADMRRVYARSKIMLMPSRWEEAWGRIASEAQVSGIPVVASNRGGLPESVGPGGILLDPDGPIEAWVEAVSRLWHDAGFYAEKSKAALEYSRRPDLDRSSQASRLLDLMCASMGVG